MTPVLIIVGLIALLLTGLPVAFGLASLGTLLIVLKGLPLALIPANLFGGVNDFVLIAVPLFLFMSNILLRGGVGRDLFVALQSWVGHFPGGLGIAALLSCGIFAAISGSSVTTAATVGTVAIPEMIRRGYGTSFTLGLLAAGGTLGILIPPSVPLIVYGVIAEESIGKLFLAGIGPGLALILVFGIYAVFAATFGSRATRSEKATWAERLSASRRALPTALLAVLMLGGIYSGAFTPTEASGIGASAALLITVLQRSLSWQDFLAALRDSVMTTSVIFLIVVGAKIFGRAITLYQIPAEVAEMFSVAGDSRWVFLLIVSAILLFVGLFLESMSMLLIMVPVLLPTVLGFGIDPVWFGVYFVLLIEIALITPPVGLNLFVIQAIARTGIGTVIRGVTPFVLLMLLIAVLMCALPGLALLIPYGL
ncbi:C4-dicarboxylate ABC transporter permease [Rhodovulum sulfidophilum]|uniref:TRAP transporter large permease protein n=1 Tax=Rhodovulum visakhapatnamense TaxID=364297 RepID=A0ABS1RG39_9RHOB|nr:TRAP transporter large permease [Rhodovulum visakhapatnamense]MBL3568617.1 TRAP transporter large permease [Rhodovulum visakhapatnamense]MBL3578495.1 TRAP transporter large permease [Rhodovulum visakhapatnamense]OLS43819.1 C4-dicarboxylate ABC transporter permease [Rhodovulum sulfidophilum]